jgi:hypothetical protein
LNIGLFFLLCALSIAGQESKCVLKLAELPGSPELFGFHMGMTPDQVKKRVPQVAFGRVNEFGVSKTSINPDFDSSIDKASLAGVRTVSLDFLDDRLTSFWLGYDSGFKWQTVPTFVKGISQALHLPEAWTPWKVGGQQLNCADFHLTVSFVAEGPSFHVIDQVAEQTLAARRQAKEEQDAALEEGEAKETGEIIADRKARIYYLDGCKPAHELREDERVSFKTKEEAEKAGYKLAKGCQ